jgi:hypothetical protein
VDLGGFEPPTFRFASGVLLAVGSPSGQDAQHLDSPGRVIEGEQDPPVPNSEPQRTFLSKQLLHIAGPALGQPVESVKRSLSHASVQPLGILESSVRPSNVPGHQPSSLRRASS